MKRAATRFGMFAAAVVAIAIVGCAGGGGGRDGGRLPEAGMTDTGVGLDGPVTDDGGDSGLLDLGLLDSGTADAGDGGMPMGTERTAYDLVAGGHVSLSAHYRLVSTTLSTAAPATPSSAHYVLRENVIGRIGDP